MAHCQTLNSYFVPRALSWSWKLKSPLLVKLASASVGISPKLKYNLASTPLGVLEVLAISYNILSLISDTLTRERHCEQWATIVWSGQWTRRHRGLYSVECTQHWASGQPWRQIGDRVGHKRVQILCCHCPWSSSRHWAQQVVKCQSV